MVYMRAVELAGGLPVVLPPLAPERVGAARRAARGHLPLRRPGPRARRLRRAARPEPRPDGAARSTHSSSASPSTPTGSGCPILGICRGLQALNVARGGTLHQHLPDVTDGSIDHRQTEPGHVTHARRADRARLALGGHPRRGGDRGELLPPPGGRARWAATCAPSPGRRTARSRASRATASGSCSACSGTPRGSSAGPSTSRSSRRWCARRRRASVLQAA